MATTSLDAAAAAMRDAMRQTVRRYWLWYLVQGILMVVTGILALIYPWIASVAMVYYFKPRFGATLDRQVFFVAFGVLVAGVAQAVFQLPSLRAEGFRYEWVSPWNDETVRGPLIPRKRFVCWATAASASLAAGWLSSTFSSFVLAR